MLGMAGAALFYGDCLLTPAISVLSAVEGLNIATPAFEPLVVPLALGVIVGAVRRPASSAPAGVGRWFGPITLVWFVVLLVLGLHADRAERRRSCWRCRRITPSSSSPATAFVAFVALGAVTLAVTGAEALYADMGHFGAKPIRMAWLCLVLPALLANYYGQGALLLRRPERAREPVLPPRAGLDALPAGRARRRRRP